MDLSRYKLILVTNKENAPIDEYLNFVKICAQSGITAIQLREKNASFEALVQFGFALKKELKPFNIPLIVNDNLQLALELDAEGLHLGQNDGDVIAARNKLGSKKIIGLSIDSIEQLHQANLLPIDYLGCGAIFPTKNKKNITTIWGLNGLKEFISLAKHPVVAIGGINESNTKAVLETGASGIAAIGAFHDSKDLVKTIQTMSDKT